LVRVWEHQNDIYKGFTQQYGCKRLVWYELHHDRADAFARERALKRWKRQWKIDLIETSNPHWDDLSLRLTEDNLYDEARFFEA
jgi:putative endonuclease